MVNTVPRVVDHAERRRAITDATVRSIATVGLEQTTMRRIASEAGSTTGLVTHYFPDKDALLRSALRHVHRTAGERMHAAIEKAADPLRAVICESLPLDDRRRTEWRVWLAFWGKAATSAELAEEQRSRYVEWRDLLERVIAGADVDVDAELLMATIDGLGVRATVDPDGPSASEQLAVVERVLDGR